MLPFSLPNRPPAPLECRAARAHDRLYARRVTDRIPAAPFHAAVEFDATADTVTLDFNREMVGGGRRGTIFLVPRDRFSPVATFRLIVRKF